MTSGPVKAVAALLPLSNDILHNQQFVGYFGGGVCEGRR